MKKLFLTINHKLDLIEKHKQGTSLGNLAVEFRIGKTKASNIVKSEKACQDYNNNVNSREAIILRLMAQKL